MDAERDMTMAIGWNQRNLRLLGVWPDPNVSPDDDRSAKRRFMIIIFLIVIFICGPQSANLFIIWGDINLMTENLTMANMTVVTALIKLLFLGYHREALKPVLAAFVDDWKGMKTEFERSIMLQNGVLGRRISICCTILTEITVTTFLLLRMMIIMRLNRNETDADHAALYPAYFPYDPRNSPAFELTIFGQVIGAYCAATSSTAVDSFISMLVLHNCGQFAKLRGSLEGLFDQGQERTEVERYHEAICKIIRRHEHLDWFAKTIEKCFNVLLLAQMLSSVVELCFQGFQAFGLITDTQGNLSLFELFLVIVHMSYVMVHLYLYCYIGEMLFVQSSAMSFSAYNSKWYDAPSNQGRDLLLIMLRSTIPLRLTAGKFGTFSLEMFSSIIKTSMGYLSVLLTVTSHTD